MANKDRRKTSGKENCESKKGVAIFAAVLAILFGILIGLTQGEDKKYSYKM